MSNKKGDKVACDGIDKASGPRKRAGHTVERVAKASAKGVPHEVIALQLTANSWHGNEYTAAEIPTLIKVFGDSKSKVGMTKTQTEALIGLQQEIQAEQSVAYPETVANDMPEVTKEHVSKTLMERCRTKL